MDHAETVVRALLRMPWRPKPGYNDGFPYLPEPGKPLYKALVLAHVDLCSKERLAEFVTAVDAGLSSVETARRVASWSHVVSFANFENFEGRSGSSYSMLEVLQSHPTVISTDLAAGICSIIEDPNKEDKIRKLIPRIPTAVLDSPVVARACLRALDCHMRHVAVALGVYARISAESLYPISEELYSHVKHVSSNKRLLSRMERIVAKIESPKGPAFRVYCEEHTRRERVGAYLDELPD